MEQPKIPTLKDSQKPQVKIKGIQAGLTLLDRMKQFKKKDLAFILAGLGTLFMAPLAEHFMMSPETGDATLQQGWAGGKGGGNNLFGSGASPYEPGTSGTAPGSAIGGGSDVITPLNVRDPSALVMGPGASQQPPSNSAGPVTPPPSVASRSEPDLKDALAGAAARAASAAVKKAPLPVPKMALGGSGLRGLGVAGGGSSASGGLGGISSNGLASGKADTGGGLGNVRSSPGYRGVGTRGPNNANGGALEALKAAAGKAGEAMNRGSATSGLAEAAAQQMPTGGAGFSGAGSGAMGGADKGPGGNAGKDSKSVGESLDFINKKSRMEKELELEFEKRKKEEMFWPDLTREMTKEFMMKGLLGPISECAGSMITKASITNSKCFASNTGYWACAGPDGPMDNSQLCDGKAGELSNCWDDNTKTYYDGNRQAKAGVKCSPKDGAKGSGGEAPGGNTDGSGVGSVGGVTGEQGKVLANIVDVCREIALYEKTLSEDAQYKDVQAQLASGKTASGSNGTIYAAKLKGLQDIKKKANLLASAQEAMTGTKSSGCEYTPIPAEGATGDAKNVAAIINAIMLSLDGVKESGASYKVRTIARSQSTSDAKSDIGLIATAGTEGESNRKAAASMLTQAQKNVEEAKGIVIDDSNQVIKDAKSTKGKEGQAEMYKLVEPVKTLGEVATNQDRFVNEAGLLTPAIKAATLAGGDKGTLTIVVQISEDSKKLVANEAQGADAKTGDGAKLDLTIAQPTVEEKTGAYFAAVSDVETAKTEVQNSAQGKGGAGEAVVNGREALNNYKAVNKKAYEDIVASAAGLTLPEAPKPAPTTGGAPAAIVAPKAADTNALIATAKTEVGKYVQATDPKIKEPLKIPAETALAAASKSVELTKQDAQTKVNSAASLTVTMQETQRGFGTRMRETIENAKAGKKP